VFSPECNDRGTYECKHSKWYHSVSARSLVFTECDPTAEWMAVGCRGGAAGLVDTAVHQGSQLSEGEVCDFTVLPAHLHERAAQILHFFRHPVHNGGLEEQTGQEAGMGVVGGRGGGFQAQHSHYLSRPLVGPEFRCRTQGVSI